MNATQTLYEIDQELSAIVGALEELAIPEETIRASIDEWLDSNNKEIAVKLDNYCKVIAERTALAKIRREEAQAIVAMAQFDEKVCETLKDRAKAFFERAGMTSLVTAHFKPRVQANGGVLPMKLADEVIQNPAILPEKFRKIVPNAEAIRLALEEVGGSLYMESGGDCEFKPLAWLEERGSHFRLR